MNKRIKISLAVLSFILVILLCLVLSGHDIFVDTIVSNFMKSIRCDTLTKFFKTITVFGNAKIIISLTLISIILLPKREYKIAIPFNVCMVGLINQVVKRVVRRARPLVMLIDESGYSFPSGHAMISTAFYGYLFYLVKKNVKNKVIKNILLTLIILLIVLIITSRVYLSVHYFTDVLAGSILSLIYLILFINLKDKIISKKFN